ncbi:hypothetical protein [Selenomonas ruminantium]|uniref:hypothetical protein n=1 Tax=Selenomonas ruminantium TaxID=971 RepID=UPI0026F170A9|nr:hypothetical protein [Selenomonas ruminantium]
MLPNVWLAVINYFALCAMNGVSMAFVLGGSVVLTVAWFEERENIVREKFLRRKMMRLLFRKYDDDYAFTAKHKKDFHKLGEMSVADTKGGEQDIKSYVKDVVENTDDLQTYAKENLSMEGSPLKKRKKPTNS